MTDREILGLAGPFGPEKLKRAYRNRSKQLHPDRNGDSLNSHLAMIRLNRAYGNLKKEIGAQPERSPSPPAEGDEAYAVYREGIRLFQNIHPYKWKKQSRDGLFDPSAVLTHEEAPAIIQSLIPQMSRAYHCFSRVIGEYEDSPWYADSLRQMGEIEKMTGRYAKIKESYESELRKRNDPGKEQEGTGPG